MIASQAVCLLIGLWLQDRFVLSLAEWNSSQSQTNPSQLALGLQEDPPIAELSTENNQATTPTSAHETAFCLAMAQARPLAFVWICGLQAIVAYLLLTRMHVEHSRRQEHSYEELLKRDKELVRTRDAVIFGLAKLAESRDPETGHHLERIALYSTRLATTMHRLPRYRNVVTPNFVRMIGVSSALHDIGKVGVSDGVLLKRGKLTTEERCHMQTHTTLGGECLRQIETRLGNSSFLAMACEIAFHHHERWDGAGYPACLEGEMIPLAARIVSIADVYDALVSRRVYKEAFCHDKCVEMIRREAGKQFDAGLVEVFLSIEGQFRAISDRYREEPQMDTDLTRSTGDKLDELPNSDPEETKLLETLESIKGCSPEKPESDLTAPPERELAQL